MAQKLDFYLVKEILFREYREADTVQEVTGKIALIIGSNFLITIHRKQWETLDFINKKCVKCRGKAKIEHMYCLK